MVDINIPSIWFYIFERNIRGWKLIAKSVLYFPVHTCGLNRIIYSKVGKPGWKQRTTRVER